VLAGKGDQQHRQTCSPAAGGAKQIKGTKGTGAGIDVPGELLLG